MTRIKTRGFGSPLKTLTPAQHKLLRKIDGARSACSNSNNDGSMRAVPEHDHRGTLQVHSRKFEKLWGKFIVNTANLEDRG
jgi:hypothetical protein